MKIVFDLDGTLADCSHRVHFLQQEKPDWEAFYNACMFDKPMQPMLDLFRVIRRGYAYCPALSSRLQIWTGRPERYRVHTAGWFMVHDVRVLQEDVWMRPDDDHRPDYELKADWLKISKPDLVFEDRKQVVDMYRSHGILVAQIAEGNY